MADPSKSADKLRAALKALGETSIPTADAEVAMRLWTMMQGKEKTPEEIAKALHDAGHPDF